MTSSPDLSRPAAAPFAPAARRTLSLFGSTVELVWLPERQQRPGSLRSGQSTAERPPFQPERSERILRDEAVWRDAVAVLTPNRFPFAAQQWLLWQAAALREHDEPFLHCLFACADDQQATALLNAIGAAATIPRAHAHLTTERLPFLRELPEQPYRAAWLPDLPGVRYGLATTPFSLLVVRGDASVRAAATAQLQLRRTTAWNLVSEPGVTWIYPRSLEIPAPHFQLAIGAAELWGRWCFDDEAAFAAATPQQLERALCLGGFPVERLGG